MPGKTNVIRLGELFSGPGGMALGAMHAQYTTKGSTYKIEHEWANDFDPAACATYRRNLATDKPESVICRDVKELDIDKLSEIDGFAYGFPCNDFSVVGEKKGFAGIYGPLYTYGIKVLNRFKPKFFVAENVGGLASSGDALQVIQHDLENAGNGYNLVTHLYKSEEYGVPQCRHRIIIVGFEKSLGITFQIPKPTHVDNYVTCKEAIEGTPIPKDAPNNELTKQSASVVERLKYIKPGENAWTANMPEELKLNVKKTRLSQIYKRLDPDKPSYTITGSGGGGTHVYHWSEPRALTNRERARLQSFPDEYIFEGSKEQVRKQIGMAVPPQLSQIIFTQILKQLAEAEIK